MKHYQIIYRGDIVGEIEISEANGAEFTARLKQNMPGISLVPLKPPVETPSAGGIGAAMVRAMIGSYERRNQY